MLLNAPLIRLRHLLPPQKNRGGRRALDKESGERFRGEMLPCEIVGSPYIEKGRCK